MKHAINRIAKNTVYSTIGRASEAISGILTIMLATRYLGVKVFGEYAFIRVIAFALTPIIAFGSLRILIREISVKKEHASEFVISGLALNVLTSIVVWIIATLIAFFYRMDSTTIIALYLALLSQVLYIMTNTLGTVFIAYEKMVYDAATSIIPRTVTILLFVLVAYFDLGMMGLLISLVIANAIGVLSTIVILAYRFTKIKWSVNFKYFAFIFRESLPIAISTFLSQAYTYINVFQIKIYWDAVQVSLFQAPQRIIAPLMIVPNAFLFATVPTLSRLGHESNARMQLRFAYRKAFKYIIIITLPFCIYATINALKIVSLLFGEKFSESAASFQILLWTVIPVFINALIGFLITSINKQKVLTISSSICFMTNCVLGFILVKNYGNIGASWAFLISCMVLLMVNFYYISKYLYFIPVHHIILQPLFAGLTMYLFFILFANKINIALLGVCAFLMYFGVLFLSNTFTSDEIEIFKNAIPARFKKNRN